MRMFFGGNIEIELLNKSILGQFKYHCANFNYPGIVVNRQLKNDFKKVELDVYNKFLNDYYGNRCVFPAVKYNPEDCMFKVVDVDDMPFHIYHALKTKTFLPTGMVTKKYYRTTHDEDEYEICQIVERKIRIKHKRLTKEEFRRKINTITLVFLFLFLF
jgi:hypothetical protein